MNPRSGILIGLLVTVVAGFAFNTFALKPKRQEAAKLATEIEQQQQQLDAARTLLASNERARDRYRRAYATVVRLGKAVPADDDVRSLVVQLEEAAREAKVDFASIGVGSGAGAAPASGAPSGTADAKLPPGASVGPAGFPVMQFTFTFRGRFFRLGDYFERLHGFVRASNDRLRVTGRLLTLDSLKLSPDGDGFQKILASVSATSYLTSPLEGLTAGATATGPAGAAGAGATPGATAVPPTTPTPAPGGTTPPAPTTATSTGGIR